MFRYGLPAAVAALALDQASKWWIRAVVMDPPREIEITPFFQLVLAWNRGISFSFFRSDSPVAPFILAGVALAIVVGLLVWMRRMDRAWPAIAVGLIVGGAVGNVFDRLYFRAVVDFLYFHWREYYWPAFNLADTAITIGVAMLLLDGLFGRAGKTRKAQG
jgi:signal peptidase II